MRMRELQGFASPVWEKNLHPTGSIFFPTALAAIAPSCDDWALCISSYSESVSAAGGCWRAFAPQVIHSMQAFSVVASQIIRFVSFGSSCAFQSSLFRGLFFLLVQGKF